MPTFAPRGVTPADIAKPMKEHDPFTCGKLSGYPGRSDHVGELPREHHEPYQQARYTVLSYDTPIAWRGKDGKWVIPQVTYSRATSQHQSLIRAATGLT